MKNCKKIISSILTLTLFAGSVVNLTCFADGNEEPENPYLGLSASTNTWENQNVMYPPFTENETLNPYPNASGNTYADPNLNSNQNSYQNQYPNGYDMQYPNFAQTYQYPNQYTNVNESQYNESQWASWQLQQQEAEIENFNRRHEFANELDEIKNSVNERSNVSDFNNAFERLETLKAKFSADDNRVLANRIQSTESYLKENQKKAFEKISNLYEKKTQGTALIILTSVVGFIAFVGHFILR